MTSRTLRRGVVLGIAVFPFASCTLITDTCGCTPVPPSIPSDLGFLVWPTNTAAGVAFSPSIQVRILTAAGNVSSGATNLVTLAITSVTGTTGASLVGTMTVSAVGGVATFPGLKIDTAGTNYRLTASSPGLTSATSVPFAISSPP